MLNNSNTQQALQAVAIGLFLFLTSAVGVNSQTIQQSGSVTPGHLACFVSSGVVRDCGTSSNPLGNALGLAATSFGTLGVKNGTTATNPTTMTLGVTDAAARLTVTTSSGSNLPFQICVQGTCTDWANIPSIPVTVPQGGTGLTSGTAGGVPYYPTTTTMASSGALTADRLVVGGGTSGPSVLGAGTTTTVLHGNASGAPTFGAVTLTTDVTGTLPIANGGTASTTAATAATTILDGLSTTQGSILYRNASAWVPLTPGTMGQILTTQGAGANPSWTSVPGTGTVTSVATGTGLTGGPITTAGTILFADVASNRILANITGGAAPPIANTMTSLMDILGSTNGQIPYRTGGTWAGASNFTTGFTATANNLGTATTGTVTPDPANGNLQRLINGGAFTLACPTASGDYTLILQITNNGSAGTITVSGCTLNDGSSFSTTNGDDFMVFFTKINGFTYANNKALQ